jgi:hypothetical protein
LKDKNVRKILLVSPLFLMLAGCHTYAVAVKPGPYTVGSYQVSLDQTWSKLDIGAPSGLAATVLTFDGLLLNRVYLVDSLEAGKPLVKPVDTQKASPVFRNDMSPTELSEFISDSLAAQDYKNVEVRGLHPQAFGRSDGVRFDISAATSSGLLISGSALAAIVNGKLDAIIYLAPQEYYHDLRQADVERIMQSATLR